MAAMSRLLPMMAFSTFAIFLLALLATPTNALSNAEPHVHARGHDSIAKRKRNAVKRAKRCRPKSTSLPAATSTSAAASNTPAPTSTKAKTSTQPATTAKPATSTVTTSKAVATTSVSSSSGGGGGGKLLLSWPNGGYGMEPWTGKNLGGLYSWSPDDPGAGKIGADFYPMLWGNNQQASFKSKINGSKYKYCMGFNEPNQVGQSDMSVADGVKLWKSTMEPARAQGCQLVCPATTSAPSGLQWVKDFVKACPECHCDAISLHWYDVSLEDFKTYVTKFHTTFNLPIWITEFACQNFNGGAQCSEDETWALHQGMAKFARDNDWIHYIAPFGAMRDMQGVNAFNQLMDPSSGEPNALGDFWLNSSW